MEHHFRGEGAGVFIHQLLLVLGQERSFAWKAPDLTWLLGTAAGMDSPGR